MRFVDSWFLRAGFGVLLLSVAFLLAGSYFHNYWAPRVGSLSVWELVGASAVLGLQIGSLLMIVGVVLTLYRKARIRNPRLH